MIPLVFLPLFLVQDPAPAHAAVSVHEVDARELFRDWAARMQNAAVLHLQADGVLVTADKEKPQISLRWTFSTEIWMAKGGIVNARTRWTGPRPEHGEPQAFTSIAFANGVHAWQGIEGPQALTASELSTPRFVPYPLPEIFGVFDGKPGADLPATKVSHEFDWGEPLPTVIVIDPSRPATEPTFWFGFGERELAGWCSMQPDRLGGDIVRGKLKKVDWLEHLPQKDPPRFEPK